jgi:hypothetical protein
MRRSMTQPITPTCSSCQFFIPDGIAWGFCKYLPASKGDTIFPSTRGDNVNVCNFYKAK